MRENGVTQLYKQETDRFGYNQAIANFQRAISATLRVNNVNVVTPPTQ